MLKNLITSSGKINFNPQRQFSNLKNQLQVRKLIFLFFFSEWLEKNNLYVKFFPKFESQFSKVFRKNKKSKLNQFISKFETDNSIL